LTRAKTNTGTAMPAMDSGQIAQSMVKRPLSTTTA
jgi:hypothetical protein